ncbi:MAG TPA: transposase [Isosphaeraceae bacterium]|nr:transposase [Isosphaeraceae bacterium]
MPRPRSYHRPQAPITVEYTASTLSRWGFFPAIWRYLQRLELPRRLQRVTLPSASNAHFQPVDKLTTLVTLFITGIARISHIDHTLAGETALARLLGLDRFPSSDTLYNVLGRVTAWHVKQVDRIHRRYLDEQARFDQGSVIADLDLSVKSTEGRKRQGAPPGHNPNHKGRDCYQWAVAFASGVVVWQQLCRGCTSGQSLVKPALEAVRQRMPHLAILRLDGGFLSAKVLNLLVSQHVGFLVKAGTKLVSVRALVERTRAEQWQSYDEDTRLCRWNRVQLLDGYRTPVTVVLVECRRRIKKMRKGRLYWKIRTCHYAIVTDQHHWPTAKIYETYKARWAVENFFKESNQSFSSGKLPSGKYRGNQFFLALLSVVYNLMQFFKRDCLPGGYRMASFATVRRHFLEHAVIIEGGLRGGDPSDLE